MEKIIGQKINLAKSIYLWLFISAFTHSAVVYSANISPYTQSRIKNVGRQISRLKSESGKYSKESFSCYVTFSQADVPERLSRAGITVNSIIDNILTSELTIEEIDYLSKIEGIDCVEMGVDVSLSLDKAIIDTSIDKVISGTETTSGYDGSGVIVGIIDNGLQLDHINFYDSQKRLRIKSIWLQNDNKGTPPSGFSYGSEYKSQSKIESIKYDTLVGTHATHVAGIAVGGYKESGFYGAAPGADIVFVSFSNNSTSISDAISYIYSYAKAENKPAVINMSLGSFLGPKDGSSTFDKLADSLQGNGKLLVGSAGNNGDTYMHISKEFANTSDTLKSFFKCNYDLKKNDYIEIYGEKNSDFGFKMCLYNTSTGKVLKETNIIYANLYGAYKFSMSSGIVGDIEYYSEKDYVSQRPHILLVKNITSVADDHAVAVKIIGKKGEKVHAWDYLENFTDCGMSGWSTGDNSYTISETGGTGNRIISVGSYVTKLYNPVVIGDISPMSGRGPTTDERRKPDVTAPGDVVVSSYSNSPNIINSNFYKPLIEAGKTIEVDGKKYYYGVMAGTSMAAPLVTGTLASWLQARPSLSPEEVGEIIKKHSRQDNFTGDLSVTGNTWGYGKLDAWNGLKECLLLNGIEEVEQESGVEDVLSYCSKSEIRLLFSQPCNYAVLSIYSITGKKIMQRNYFDITVGREEIIPIPSLAPGIYIINIVTERTNKTQKIYK